MEDSVAGRLAALESAFVILADLPAERGPIDAGELRRLLGASRPDVPDGPRGGGRALSALPCRSGADAYANQPLPAASSRGSHVELDRQPRAALDLPGGGAADLAHEALDQRETGAAGLGLLRHPPAVVPEPQAGLARVGPPELQADGPGPAPRRRT